MPNQKTEQNKSQTTGEPHSYLFEYDTRYHTSKSDPPTIARVSLQGGRLHYERIEIPRTGTGTKIVRLKGSYTGSNGDVFLNIDGTYSEITVVHCGTQFAIWWGDSENVAAQCSWLTGFLAHDPLSFLHVIPRLENHLDFIRQRGLGRPGEEAAMLDLIRSLHWGVALAAGTGDSATESFRRQSA